MEKITRKQFADELCKAERVWFMYGGFLPSDLNVSYACSSYDWQYIAHPLGERKVLQIKSNGIVFSCLEDGGKSTLGYEQLGKYSHYRIGNLLVREFEPKDYDKRNYCIYRVA